MYIGSWKIDDLLTFVANTHRFDTGAATDADSAASYRVYEDETGTPLLTGSMALLDSSNTAGFYSEQITLSAANGFEKGKCYSIYISATVNSVTGTTHRTFQIEAEVDANTVSGTVASVGSVTGNVGGNVSGSVGSVTGNVGGIVVGSVGSVTGNVGGNVVGSVGSVVGDVGGDVVGSVDSVTQKVTPIDVDGITHASAMEFMLAVVGGVAVPSGGGTTVAFKKRNGTTTKATITYGTEAGERTGSTINS